MSAAEDSSGCVGFHQKCFRNVCRVAPSRSIKLQADFKKIKNNLVKLLTATENCFSFATLPNVAQKSRGGGKSNKIEASQQYL